MAGQNHHRDEMKTAGYQKTNMEQEEEPTFIWSPTSQTLSLSTSFTHSQIRDTPLAQISTAQSKLLNSSTLSQTSELTKSLTFKDEGNRTPSENGMSDSVDSILARALRSPQAIPEGKVVDYASSPITTPVTDPFGELSRNSSTRSFRNSGSRSTRIGPSRRSSRRSGSLNASASPAYAFLSSWANASDPITEPQPDDEGQPIGIDDKYIIGRLVNSGGFGDVKEVHTINESGVRVVRAVKIVRKSVFDQGDVESDKIQQDLEHEVSIWRHLKHTNILRLHAVYDTDYATYCIMDLNLGGTLFDLVRIARAQSGENHGRKSIPMEMAKHYAYQLASALRYLHEDMRICHRDVKLENCLVDMSAADAGRNGGHLRLCDFGLADFLHSDQTAAGLEMGSMNETRPTGGDQAKDFSVIGTLQYASPEGLGVSRKLYATAGDVWAFGVVMYALCTGELPFQHPLLAKTCENISQSEWDSSLLDNGDSDTTAVLSLIRSCLEKEIVARATIGEVLDSSWFGDCYRSRRDSISMAW